MIKDGADILDVGGESTRPGHTPVSAEEEAARVVPVIEALRKRFDVPISVDTYKGSVADAAVQAGADLVNDVWGLKYDPDMAGVIAKHDVACCLMHNKVNTEYNNFLIRRSSSGVSPLFRVPLIGRVFTCPFFILRNRSGDAQTI